jgi:hypothetical protein
MIEYDKMNELMIRCNTKDLDVFILQHKWTKLTSMTCDEIIKMSDESWKHRIFGMLIISLVMIQTFLCFFYDSLF